MLENGPADATASQNTMLSASFNPDRLIHVAMEKQAVKVCSNSSFSFVMQSANVTLEQCFVRLVL